MDQPVQDSPKPAGKGNKRRGRKSSSLAHDNGAVSDSAAHSASPAPQSQGTPKPRHHAKNITGTQSPRTNPRTQQGPATPLKEGLWAGPAFHASPDPSSLPIPRFFKQPAPALSTSPSHALVEASEEDDDLPASPSRKPTTPAPTANLLGQLFAADRKERQPDKLYEGGTPIQQPKQTTGQNGSYYPPQERHSPSPFRPQVADQWSQYGSPQQRPPWIHGQHRSYDGQPTRTPPPDTQANGDKDARAMADDLKRILKIGPFS